MTSEVDWGAHETHQKGHNITKLDWGDHDPKTIYSILTLLHQTESLVDQCAWPHWARTSSGVERVVLFNLMVFERSVIYHAFNLCQAACLLEYSGTVWGSGCSAIVGDLGMFFKCSSVEA